MRQNVAIEQIEEILTKRLGADAAALHACHQASKFIHSLMNSAIIDGRKWPISAGPTNTKSRFAELVLELIPLAIEERDGVSLALMEMERRSDCPGLERALSKLRSALNDLERLDSALAGVSDECRRMVEVDQQTRKKDHRSEWGPTARSFASIIELSFGNENIPVPTRKSKSSALVGAVTDLLSLCNGEKFEADRVRKGLGKFGEKKSSQA